MLPAAANAGSWGSSFCLASVAANSEVCILFLLAILRKIELL